MLKGRCTDNNRKKSEGQATKSEFWMNGSGSREARSHAHGNAVRAGALHHHI